MICRLFFFNDTATTEIYTLSLHDALPIWNARTILTNLDILLATSLTEILVSERFSHFEREVRLAHDRFVRGLQPPVYNGEAFAKLFLRDAQRRGGGENVSPPKRIEAVLKEERSEER